MSLEALLIVLMAGTEIFRPLRDLRTVLHQGLTGQAAAAGINALLDEPVTAPGAPASPAHVSALAPSIAFEDVRLRLPRRPARRAPRAVVQHRRGRAGRRRRAQRLRQVLHRAAAAAAARPAERRGPHRRPRPARARSGCGAQDDRGGGAGHLPVPRHGRGQPAARPPEADRVPSSSPPPAPPTRMTSSQPCPMAIRR